MDYKIELINNEIGILRNTDKYKSFDSEYYKFIFDKESGFFVRFGKNPNPPNLQRKIRIDELYIIGLWNIIWGVKVDPFEFINNLDMDCDFKLQLCDILDIEVSTKCSGVSIDGGTQSPCKFCYKSNNKNGEYMDTATFTQIIDKMPPTLCQCALGIGDINQPNLFELFQVCHDRDIIPNITINGSGMTDELYDGLKKYCGAVAVSYYDKEQSFNAIYELSIVRKMTQINCHFFLADETFDKALQFLDDIKSDDRLSKINAVVFLSLKQKGNAKYNRYTPLSQTKFNIIVDKALEYNIGIGFDSCSCQKAIIALQDKPNADAYLRSCDPCESTLGSVYINSLGYYYPCSFCEGETNTISNWSCDVDIEPTIDWSNGINVLECNDFLKDVWFHQKTRLFSERVIDCRNQCISCPVFKI